MIISLVIFVVLFLCWGSFLNVVGYRLLTGTSLLWPRSSCPRCTHVLAWYDLIPVISWLMLRARCRYCKRPISWLYPIIELITALILSVMILRIQPHYWLAYGFFFSALIVSLRTDLQELVISRFVSVYAIPVGFLAAGLQLLPISLISSIAGALAGYTLLWAIAAIFKYITGKEGMGSGDFELLGFIGSFVGIGGITPTLLIASLCGALIGIALIMSEKATRETKLPFGPFLALGSVVYSLFPTVMTPLL